MHAHSPIERSNRVSAILALACAIHCAAMPMLISVLPLIGMQFLASHLMEGLLLAFGIGTGAYGIVRTYLQHRRESLPLTVFGIGTLLVAVGYFFAPESVEPFVVSGGALTIAAAQVLNIRLSRKCADHQH